MHPRKRWTWFLALATALTLIAACGGQTPEPPAEEETPAVTEETPPAAEMEPEPEPLPEEPTEPAPPQLQGNIVEIGEAEMVWLTPATRETPATYYWLVRLRNDTTQTLDITVTFEFLNEQDGVVKTDRSTQRIQPAGEGEFRVEGEMGREDSLAVVSYTYSWDWNIIDAS